MTAAALFLVLSFLLITSPRQPLSIFPRHLSKMATIVSLIFPTSNMLVAAFTRLPPAFSTKGRHATSSRLVSKRTILDPPISNDTNHDTHDWQYVLHLAEDSAQRAGEIMRATTGKIAVSKEKANTRDIVTDADVACQQVIRQTIDAVFPHHVFLGEEQVASGSQASIQALETALQDSRSSNVQERLLWIVDPIDGTTNFQNGLPLFCASIGVVAWNQTTSTPDIKVGVIYNPILGEMTSAVAGRGAYLNGKRINTTQTSIPLNEALVNVGFPVVKESTLVASSKAVAALATRVRGLRMIACASQVIAWVARNQMQAYVSWDLNAWDVCAGMLILQQSGGTVLDMQTGRNATLASRDLIFASPNAGIQLADEMRQVLKDNNCIDYN